MKNPELAERILQHVYRTNYQPVKPKVILRQLDLPEDDYRTLIRTIKRLVQQGQLVYGANHLVSPQETQPPVRATNKRNSEDLEGENLETTKSSESGKGGKFIQGTFRSAAAGYGFVRPVPGGKMTPTEDIFIPASSVGSALDGDLVEVRLLRSTRSNSDYEGHIESVLERHRRQFSATFQLQQGEPIAWLDGVSLRLPILVGDIRGLPLENNDKVIIELVRFPEAGVQGEGIILEVLGSSQNPAVDTLAVMRQYGLQEEFPAEVIQQARETADQYQEEIPRDRRDLTAIPTLTIDPFDARDFDDAISLSKNEVGHWELLVHIADVAHFVPAGSKLDLEARRRATSCYLPDRVIPMLPEIISNHLASLQPHKNRLTKTVLIEMDDAGTVLHTEVFNSVIHNHQRLTYEQVDQFLVDREDWKKRLKPEIHQLLGDMYELAMVLRRRRLTQGALELSLPEVKIDLDRSGKVKGAHLQVHTESHQIIEEFMLAANQAVATWLDDLKIPFLRRAHPMPELRKLRRLHEFLEDLGIPFKNIEDRFELQKIIESVRGETMEYAVNYAILKSMSKAIYQPQLERHYALDMTHYCHFTSPIRRYPDLTIHRTVQRILDQQNAVEPIPVLIRLGQQCSDAEQNAEFAERELIKVKLLHFLSRRIGQSLEGVITSVNSEGFNVRGTQLPAEGFVTVHSLPGDRYRYERHGHALVGNKENNQFRLGDLVRVAVDHVDLPRRVLMFRLEKMLVAAKAPEVTTHSRYSKIKGPKSKSKFQVKRKGDSSKGKRRPRR
ncbi:MAG: ribonuclease R [Planctomycetes bacterium]|nr:ribonuclease R [Planctomycetota bacterium]